MILFLKKGREILVDAEDCNAQVCKGQVPHAKFCDAAHSPVKTHHNDNDQVTYPSQVIIEISFVLQKICRRVCSKLRKITKKAEDKDGGVRNAQTGPYDRPV